MPDRRAWWLFQVSGRLYPVTVGVRLPEIGAHCPRPIGVYYPQAIEMSTSRVNDIDLWTDLLWVDARIRRNAACFFQSIPLLTSLCYNRELTAALVENYCRRRLKLTEMALHRPYSIRGEVMLMRR